MKPAQYKVQSGSHYDQSGREYKQGETIESWSDLCAAFANKFVLVRAADYSPEPPVAPVRPVVQPIQPPVTPVAPVVENVGQTPPEMTTVAETPAATPSESEPPKKKRKTVNLD